MHTYFLSLRRTARTLGLVSVGVLSTLGALSLTHVGPAQAQNPDVSLIAQINALKVQVSKLQADNDALKAKTSPISVSGTDLTISGVNVRIVSGSGRTDDGIVDTRTRMAIAGKPLTGLGNLIIGYNALSNTARGGHDVRTGSHNLILGDGNNYSSFGGLIAGTNNTIRGPYASVSGGNSNTADGFDASVSGGNSNTASGGAASVSGGSGNTASGGSASVTAGQGNTASGGASSVNGGQQNTASGGGASVSGGYKIMASGLYASAGGSGATPSSSATR